MSGITKKELGQHWLHDKAILAAICDAAELSSNDFVLEIGPGLGTLTELVAQESKVLALEYDKDLLAQLRAKFSDSENVEVAEGDIRKFDYNDLPHGYKITANIPYYLTSHLIRSISETDNPPHLAVLLVQKEVAERLCANAGQMSILSVTAQFYFECSLGVLVPAHYFTPPPKVDSQVVIMRRRSQKMFDVDEQDFFKFIKAGFSEKRKTLRNSLSGGLGITKEAVIDLLEISNLKSTSRAQELSLDDWHLLYEEYNSTYEKPSE